MSADRYASVPERITWTTGFRLAIDKHVLGVLSTFANFKTGKHADMKLSTLVERARVPRRTLIRSLQRLVEDGWVFARQQHRRPTIYDINEARLATHWMEAKLVESLSATSGTQTENPENSDLNLSAMGGTQEGVLSATGGTQEAVLSATGGTPSPVRTDPLLERDPKEPALRAVAPDDTETPTTTEAKVPEPRQLPFGPQAVGDRSPPARDPNWTQRFAETLRSALRKHG